jgi:hypothetical protein
MAHLQHESDRPLSAGVLRQPGSARFPPRPLPALEDCLRNHVPLPEPRLCAIADTGC